MGTPYAVCPLCGGRWTVDPPIQNRDGTGRVIRDRLQGAKHWNEYVERPHLIPRPPQHATPPQP
jgi:hypothetical protein